MYFQHLVSEPAVGGYRARVSHNAPLIALSLQTNKSSLHLGWESNEKIFVSGFIKDEARAANVNIGHLCTNKLIRLRGKYLHHEPVIRRMSSSIIVANIRAVHIFNINTCLLCINKCDL